MSTLTVTPIKEVPLPTVSRVTETSILGSAAGPLTVTSAPTIEFEGFGNDRNVFIIRLMLNPKTRVDDTFDFYLDDVKPPYTSTKIYNIYANLVFLTKCIKEDNGLMLASGVPLNVPKGDYELNYIQTDKNTNPVTVSLSNIYRIS